MKGFIYFDTFGFKVIIVSEGKGYKRFNHYLLTFGQHFLIINRNKESGQVILLIH
jgi:hypothetical protein